MDKSINITELKGEYIDEITRLDGLCFEDNWSYALFEKELSSKSSYCLVAIKDKRVIGFITVSTVLDEADITKIAVHPDCRRQGIASYLLDMFFLYCREHGINIINLELRESNSSALMLYKLKGFEIVGERKEYYNNSETAILMTRILKEV